MALEHSSHVLMHQHHYQGLLYKKLPVEKHKYEDTIIDNIVMCVCTIQSTKFVIVCSWLGSIRNINRLSMTKLDCCARYTEMGQTIACDISLP